VKFVTRNDEDVKEINNVSGYANDDEDMIDDLQDFGTVHSENTGSSEKVSSTTFASNAKRMNRKFLSKEIIFEK